MPGGHLEVGVNADNEVVVNLGEGGPTGHIVFSPDQARRLAGVLLKKAKEAEMLVCPPTIVM